MEATFLRAALLCSLRRLLPGGQNLDILPRCFQYNTLFIVFQKLVGNWLPRKRKQKEIRQVKATPFHWKNGVKHLGVNVEHPVTFPRRAESTKCVLSEYFLLLLQFKYYNYLKVISSSKPKSDWRNGEETGGNCAIFLDIPDLVTPGQFLRRQHSTASL